MQAVELTALVRGYVMSKYILKYKRGSEVKYISHLDFIHFMQRVIRRSGLLMEYSQGFNPHPQMSVALPLSVGVTADGELMKVSFVEDYDEKFIMDTLNESFPKGFEIVNVRKTEGKEFDFSKIDRAEYICDCELEEKCHIDIEKFMANEKILVMKKSKSGVREADIKSHIHSLEILEQNDDSVKIKMIVDAGNVYNLKPDTVLEAMKKYDETVKISFYLVHRCKLLVQNKELI